MGSGPRPRRPSSRPGPDSPTWASTIAPSARSSWCKTFVPLSDPSHKSRRPSTLVSSWGFPAAAPIASAAHKGVENSRERDDALLRPLVVAHAGERRRAHVTVLRELEEVRLDDNLGFGPEPDMRIDLRDLGERTLLLPQGDEPLEERPSEFFGETGPDAADMEERAFEIGPEDQGPERVRALALARGDPADDAVQSRLLLDLDPVFASLADVVSGLPVLRDDAFEAPRDDRVVVIDPAAFDVVAQDDFVIHLDEIGQDRLALHLGEAHHGLVADVEDVEDDVRRRQGLREMVDLDLAARLLPLLEFLEARQRTVHDHDLPVEDRRFPRVDREVRIPRLDIREATVLKPQAVAHDREGPRPVPFQFEDVILRIERGLAAFREHRLDDVCVRVERRHPLSWPSRPRGSPSTRPSGPVSAGSRPS